MHISIFTGSEEKNGTRNPRCTIVRRSQGTDRRQLRWRQPGGYMSTEDTVNQ